MQLAPFPVSSSRFLTDTGKFPPEYFSVGCSVWRLVHTEASSSDTNTNTLLSSPSYFSSSFSSDSFPSFSSPFSSPFTSPRESQEQDREPYHIEEEFEEEEEEEGVEDVLQEEAANEVNHDEERDEEEQEHESHENVEDETLITGFLEGDEINVKEIQKGEIVANENNNNNNNKIPGNLFSCDAQVNQRTPSIPIKKLLTDTSTSTSSLSSSLSSSSSSSSASSSPSLSPSFLFFDSSPESTSGTPTTAPAYPNSSSPSTPSSPSSSWESKNHKRKRKTPKQLATLESEFSKNPMPNKDVREKLGEILGLTGRQVQIWFQNKRAKVRNKGKERELEKEWKKLKDLNFNYCCGSMEKFL